MWYKRSCLPAFLYDIFVRLHGLPVHQVFQCYMIYHTFDGVVQLFQRIWVTQFSSRSQMAPLSSRHSTGERLPSVRRRIIPMVYFSRSAAVHSHPEGHGHCGQSLLCSEWRWSAQVFIGDLLALRHILQADRFSCIICSKIQHQSQRISSSCRNPHVIFTSIFQYSSSSGLLLFLLLCSCSAGNIPLYSTVAPFSVIHRQLPVSSFIESRICFADFILYIVNRFCLFSLLYLKKLQDTSKSTHTAYCFSRDLTSEQ